MMDPFTYLDTMVCKGDVGGVQNVLNQGVKPVEVPGRAYTSSQASRN